MGVGGGAQSSSQLPRACTNCHEARPRSVASEAESFRCFNCGAVNAIGGASAAHAELASRPEASSAHAQTQGLGTPKQALDHQLDGFKLLSWVRPGFVLMLIPLGLLCVATSKTATQLMVLNHEPLIAVLALAPLGLIEICIAVALVRTSRARRRFESLFAAIPPREAGAMLRCHACGNTLRRAELKLVRCASCASDNLSSLRIARRAGKTDFHLDADGAELFANEAAYHYDVLRSARESSQTWTLALPAIALLVLACTAWVQDWRLPLLDEPTYAVAASPDCNMIITPARPIADGFVKPAEELRGSWASTGIVPVVYNHTLGAPDLVGKRAFLGGRNTGPITAVFRSVRSSEPKMRVVMPNEARELAVLLSCLEEANPYRNAAGLTAEEVRAANAKNDEKRKAQQGQLHIEQEPAVKGPKP